MALLLLFCFGCFESCYDQDTAARRQERALAAQAAQRAGLPPIASESPAEGTKGTWTSAKNTYETLPYDGIGLANQTPLVVSKPGAGGDGTIKGHVSKPVEAQEGMGTRRGTDSFDVDWTYGPVQTDGAMKVRTVSGTIRWSATWQVTTDSGPYSSTKENLSGTFTGTWIVDGDGAGTIEGKASGTGEMRQAFAGDSPPPDEVVPKAVDWTFKGMLDPALAR